MKSTTGAKSKLRIECPDEESPEEATKQENYDYPNHCPKPHQTSAP